MRICHCALPTMRGNSDCCKNCMNNQEYEMFPKIYITTTKETEITKDSFVEELNRLTKELDEHYDEWRKDSKRLSFTKIIG